jgi:elongation factor Ts
MVKELRERTGAGMMECKKALVESGGDMDAAVEFLRKSGLAQADKKAARVAAEGKIVLAGKDDDSEAVLVEVNCETDFVAKDDNFTAFAEAVAANALNLGGTDVDALLNTSANGTTLEEARQALVAKIGENIQVRRIVRTATDGTLGSYVHGGRIGVTVSLEGGDADLARDLAMHIAALNPEFISTGDIPQAYLDKEKEILVAQAADSGKPPEIIEKMVSGRLQKLLSEKTLLGQPFVKDGDVSVGELLKQHQARVQDFNRIEVGEGIEKKQDNFADEVMQQVSGA